MRRLSCRRCFAVLPFSPFLSALLRLLRTVLPVPLPLRVKHVCGCVCVCVDFNIYIYFTGHPSVCFPHPHAKTHTQHNTRQNKTTKHNTRTRTHTLSLSHSLVWPCVWFDHITLRVVRSNIKLSPNNRCRILALPRPLLAVLYAVINAPHPTASERSRTLLPTSLKTILTPARNRTSLGRTLDFLFDKLDSS